MLAVNKAAFLVKKNFFYSVVLRASRITLMHYFDTRTHHHNISPSFTTKRNPVSDALRTQKTKCTKAGANPGSVMMPDSFSLMDLVIGVLTIMSEKKSPIYQLRFQWRALNGQNFLWHASLWPQCQNNAI